MHFSFERIVRPFRVPVNTARGSFSHRESLLVKIADEAGRIAFGEIAPWRGFGCEELQEAETFLHACRERIPSAIPENLPCTAHAFSAAKFFLENPHAQEISPPDSRLCAKLIPRSRETAPERILEAIFRARVEGFSVFKIKIGLDEEKREADFCGKILSLVPAGTLLRFDANGAFSDSVLPAFVELSEMPSADFFEQPLPPSPENDAKILKLCDAAGAKFALDESVREPWAFPSRTRAVSVVKPLLVSDFPRLLEWLENPDGPDTVISTVFENSRAGTATLRLACSRLAAARRRAFGLG